MRIGTIICNGWASDYNPTKYFIYLGVRGQYVQGLAYDKGKLTKIFFHKKDFQNREMFRVVGYCEGINIIKKTLKEFNKKANEKRKGNKE